MNRKTIPCMSGLIALALTLMLSGCAEAQSGSWGSGAGALLQSLTGGSAGALDESTMSAGLKDALRVGSERAVGATSKPNGFLANELIRIALPKEIEPMTKALRAIGYGGQVDALEVAMNHAAEQASGEAKTVFLDAISGMTLADAAKILNGGDTAATDYFKAHTSDTLRARFMPIVKDKMAGVGLYEQYNQLTGAYSALPFTKKPAVDLDTYVTNKGLDGLFTILGQEEKNIRQNPAARTTELLQKVFANR